MSLAATFLSIGQQQDQAQLLALARTCKLVRCTGELIHHLQSERGATNLTLGAQGARFAALWESYCTASDTTRQDFEHFLARELDTLSMTGGSRLCLSIAFALNALDQLPAIRQHTLSGHSTPTEATKQYCQIVSRLIALVFEAIDAAAEPAVAKLLVALFNLIEGKEYCGIERANGARMFGAEQISDEDRAILSDLIALQEQSFNRFEAFCDPAMHQQWRILQTMLPLADIERMRRIILGSMPTVPDDAHQWFTYCTERIDRLYEVEQHLANHLEAVCRDRIHVSAPLPDPLFPSSIAASSAAPILAHPDTLLQPRIYRDLYDLLQAQALELERTHRELASVRASLEDRKLIERAKGLLMSQQAMSETQAYGLMRQKAMDQKTRIADIAKAVLAMTDQTTAAESRT